ncbi:MAG: hypothetical protein HN353_07720 [Bdellovibrionales bacterium]|jgi:hypothetical protein|nr:hypothetical protein [Bdellovibrionales bacterium]MBT3525807.1 hypothetical protein [Bdellovibrionales bacterium]MBT7668047.1 hypothetical protein [Bdellovibrionales bacterium]MBT7767251.1 hypothetical protein [Bdellovibrionales bacterium]
MRLFSIVITAALLSMPLLASELICQTKVNLELTAKQQVTIASSESVRFAADRDYTFILKRKNSNSYCLEIFSPSREVRHYSCSTLHQPGEFLEWVIWSREEMVEAICTLL